jgi:hypothetical protein
MSDTTNERPDEAPTRTYAPQGIGWHLDNVLREKTSLEWDSRLNICEEFFFRSKAANLQADCERWCAMYARQADELVAVKSRLDEAELSARHWGGVAFKNAEYADVFRARLADAEKRAEAAEQRAEAAEAKRATTRATADGSFRAQFITKDQANERD